MPKALPSLRVPTIGLTKSMDLGEADSSSLMRLEYRTSPRGSLAVETRLSPWIVRVSLPEALKVPDWSTQAPCNKARSPFNGPLAPFVAAALDFGAAASVLSAGVVPLV